MTFSAEQTHSLLEYDCVRTIFSAEKKKLVESHKAEMAKLIADHEAELEKRA